ncbi:hypothetical protein AB0L82_43155 [Nocardia sp. NPDC052001]|uniref:hypothetical protein n=1 Tax=Nocardia sp. NPDC052001 TaxID=3154853 RepID=UPI003449F49B
MTTETRTVPLYLIARLHEDVAIVDVYAVETYSAETPTCWWISLANDSYAPPTLDALDEVLIDRGFTRVQSWSPRITVAGVMRYFAEATTSFEELLDR